MQENNTQMFFEWDSNLETGVEIVDNQHKQLFALLNKFVEAYRNNSGPQEIEKAVKFLSDYVVRHFADEEELQQRYNYPDFMTHKGIHNGFKRTVAGLTEKLKTEGCDNAFAGEMIKIVADWLVHHIKGDDFRVAAHIRSLR
jgi:hemerythrin